ncbi:MAG: PstS family phosphate ABC transporter substrate-binding protein [Firmicutes bacterium]|nr:PstS family phosphate ABC transporter substrate-binding protein [[Eubacterium] siraeum]MCM1488675.1 PstS family phosphate ABC transporter substrate-binding protein [Bacillota bacterium]
MKKIKKLAVLMSAVILCGCNNSNADTVTDTQTEAPIQTESVTSAEASVTENEETPSDGLPVMDGSTSATPLEVGLKAGKLGISFSEAKKLVTHTTTHDSFKRLISGEVDMIFSVPISEEQQKMADEAGVKLIMKPVAKEGFVFVVNGKNPVDSLTSQQIKDIYSGRITNWSQVGGKDLEIIPYQRNLDSGSQNYMTKFMGDTPLSEPVSEYVAAGMGGLMDAVATYDNSEGAIGYSVYSYAAQMYANANMVSFIAVDGVKPTKNTMADESYPLLSSTYIIYTDKSPKSAEEFTDWALSEEGQKWVLESGYLPVGDMEIPDKYLAYEALGTGEVKAEGTKPDIKYSSSYINAADQGCTVTSEGYFQLNCLKDTEFQDRINEDLKNAVDSLKPYYQEKYSFNRGDTFKGISFDCEIRNGFASFTLGYKNEDIEMINYITEYYFDIYDHAVTLTYDLAEKKRIERFSDLFYKDADFVPLVNNGLAEMISQYLSQDMDIIEKIDFAGLLGEPKLFTISRVGFEADNPYFDCGPFLDFQDYDNRGILDLSPLSRYRDLKDIFTEDFINTPYSISEYTDAEWDREYYVEDGVYYTKYTGSRFHTDEEVEKENEAIYKVQHIGIEFIKEYGTYVDPVYKANFMKLGNGSCWEVYSCQVAADTTAVIDAETYELLTCEDLFGENWSDYLEEKDGELKDYIPISWGVEDKNVNAYLIHLGDMEIISVPYSEVNHKYISEND